MRRIQFKNKLSEENENDPWELGWVSFLKFPECQQMVELGHSASQRAMRKKSTN